ncbi:hypothetical protein FIBSPDRAFT_71510 [Athelia psychrophila]|uniref:Uncharacterized protein n=1 Tax=Athelia psychrophila TaxID=1759441 RepID=A0A166TXH5_9AGAM|nr:hypothetical protein FIBSPDRAFT_71510 [Fibularhizoctonia sp. CBS 109695]
MLFYFIWKQMGANVTIAVIFTTSAVESFVSFVQAEIKGQGWRTSSSGRLWRSWKEMYWTRAMPARCLHAPPHADRTDHSHLFWSHPGCDYSSPCACCPSTIRPAASTVHPSALSMSRTSCYCGTNAW